jgi:hypothetical protein
MKPKLKLSIGALIGALALLLISLIGSDDRLGWHANLTDDVAALLSLGTADDVGYMFGKDRALLAGAPIESSESAGNSGRVAESLATQTPRARATRSFDFDSGIIPGDTVEPLVLHEDRGTARGSFYVGEGTQASNSNGLPAFLGTGASSGVGVSGVGGGGSIGGGTSGETIANKPQGKQPSDGTAINPGAETPGDGFTGNPGNRGGGNGNVPGGGSGEVPGEGRGNVPGGAGGNVPGGGSGNVAAGNSDNVPDGAAGNHLPAPVPFMDPIDNRITNGSDESGGLEDLAEAPAPIPEPASLLLVGAGFVLGAWHLRKRKPTA